MSSFASALGRQIPSARKIWLNIHLWLGLTAGFVLALIGLTGSLLVIGGPMLKMQFGDIFDVAGSPAQVANVDEWIANTRRSYGDIQAVLFVVAPGFGPTGGNTAMLGVDVADKRRALVTVNPNTGLPIGRYLFGDAYTGIITTFHARFLAPGSWVPLARTTLAWVGVALIVSMATGLYLWWPRNRNWHAAFTLKRVARGRRRLLDLHNLLSVYLYLPLLVVALTGVYLARPDWIDPTVSQVSIARKPDPAALAQASKPGSCEKPTTPTQAVALARARFPSASFVLMSIPQDEALPYYVQLALPDNIGSKGQTQVWVARACPVVLTSIDGETRTGAETFQAVMHPLHGKLMLGRFGEVIVFLTGLILPLSFVTGVLLWLDTRKGRRPSRSVANPAQ